MATRNSAWLPRRGRDLNPRGACTPNGFRDGCEVRDFQVILCWFASAFASLSVPGLNTRGVAARCAVMRSVERLNRVPTVGRSPPEYGKGSRVPRTFRSQAGLGVSLAGLLEGEGTGNLPLRVRFPQPIDHHSEQLLASLGVVVEIDPRAPVLSTVVTSGRSGKTGRDLTDEQRARQRRAYFARPDKQRLLDRRDPRSDAANGAR
jgi:hypothetical protein